MKINFSDKLIAYLTLISGLSISAVAVWYSVAGLVSIFAAAVVPIMVMGIALELSKLVATVWLKMNWKIAPVMMRTYLIIAITILMFITSMGIFGFLSKAHLDQAVPTGDVAAKVSIIDEKIKTEQDNVAAAKAALTQMDNQVNERLSRSTDDKGAERAVQIRKQQAKERKSLQSDIAKSQTEIAKLREQRAPIASELRKVEAEVGPIKYIAALIYGDAADQNILEKAVRAVIIIIVAVFDPLAVVLLLASQYSFQYFRRVREEDDDMREEYDFSNATRGAVLDDTEKEFFDRGKELAKELDKAAEEDKPVDFSKYSYLNKPVSWFKRTSNEGLVPKEEPIVITRMTNPESNPEVVATPVEQPHDDGIIPRHTNLDTINNVDIPILENEETWASRVIDESQPKDFDAEDYYDYLDGRPELDESEILEAAVGSEKEAMHRWKAEHPDSSLKLQRKLFERGIIKQLPWDEYLKPQPDTDHYVQNAEQSTDTLWHRVKNAKKDQQ